MSSGNLNGASLVTKQCSKNSPRTTSLCLLLPSWRTNHHRKNGKHSLRPVTTQKPIGSLPPTISRFSGGDLSSLILGQRTKGQPPYDVRPVKYKANILFVTSFRPFFAANDPLFVQVVPFFPQHKDEGLLKLRHRANCHSGRISLFRTPPTHQKFERLYPDFEYWIKYKSIGKASFTPGKPDFTYTNSCYIANVIVCAMS